MVGQINILDIGSEQQNQITAAQNVDLLYLEFGQLEKVDQKLIKLQQIMAKTKDNGLFLELSYQEIEMALLLFCMLGDS